MKGEEIMEKFVPYEKMSKKARRELDRRKRKDWKGLYPATRKADTDAAYRLRRKEAADEY